MINFPGKEHYDVEDLRRVVEILRGKDGCPWDREQTHASLRRELLEESAELCEAIDREDPELLREELGDVLLQVLFHVSIEQEQGRFTLDDVADAECRKMISRHPHVFGSLEVSGVEEELRVWEDLKRREKSQRTTAEAMDAVCRTLPALWRAEKIQKKAAHGQPETAGAGELGAALEAECRSLTRTLESPESLPAEKALGRLLYAAVRIARWKGVDPEKALHDACEDAIAARRAEEETEGESAAGPFPIESNE